MMMKFERYKVFGLFFFLIFNVACQENIGEQLVDFNSEWEFSRPNFSNVNRHLVAVLIFKENGYAEEKNTILKYKWSYEAINKTIIIDGQKFKIIGQDKDTIRMLHTAMGFPAKLIKNKIK